MSDLTLYTIFDGKIPNDDQKIKEKLKREKHKIFSMYQQFFGLNDNPFNLTPNPKYLYLSENENHREALAKMMYGVTEKKGFIVITGEVGIGKTTLLHTLIKNHLNSKVHSAFIFNPTLSLDDFFASIQEEFGINHTFKGKGDFLGKLNKFLIDCLAKGENVTLIIDEAHKLTEEHLEEIRLLLNLETSEEKLLQIILSGQPELNDVLKQPSLRQLRQRIGLRHHIPALSLEETRGYISHRLSVAGYSSNKLPFTQSAILSIFQKSGGIPRLINIFCDNALLNGYAEDRKRIDEKTIDEIDCDLNSYPSSSGQNHSNSTKTSSMSRKAKSYKNRYLWLILCIFLAGVFGSFYRDELFGIVTNLEKRISIEKKIASISHYLAKIQLGKDQGKIDRRSSSDNPIDPKISTAGKEPAYPHKDVPYLAQKQKQDKKRQTKIEGKLESKPNFQTKKENFRLKNPIKKQSVYFGNNKWHISDKERNKLNELIAEINKLENYYILLEGYTDSFGDASSNLQLSKRRVESVKDYLLTNKSSKILIDSIITKPYGEEGPSGISRRMDENPETRRRVDIIVYQSS
jgi:general secretion pathway protein A